MDKLKALLRSSKRLPLPKAPDSKELARAATTRLSKLKDSASETARSNLKKNQEYVKSATQKNMTFIQSQMKKQVDHTSKSIQKKQQLLRAQSADYIDSAKDKFQTSAKSSAQYVRQTSSNVRDRVDPRAGIKRMINRFIGVGLAAVFLYGVGSATPGAVSKYYLEQAKRQAEDQVERKWE